MRVTRAFWFAPLFASGLLVHCVGDGTAKSGSDDAGSDASTSTDGSPAGDAGPGMDGAIIDTGKDSAPTCVVSTTGSSGALDPSFSTAALTGISNQFAANAIAIDATGRIYAARTSIFLLRYLSQQNKVVRVFRNPH